MQRALPMLARWSARGVERWLWALFALAAALISIWFGAGLLDRSLETRLIKEVLFEWQRLGQRFSVEGANWPEFKGNNHVVYMEALLKQMQHQGQVSPRQARQLSYTPRLKRMGRTDERLFLLLLPGRLVIFGLPKETFARIDNRVDGVFDPARGDFTGRPASDSTKMIGYWRL